MDRNDLKNHCIKTIEIREMMAKNPKIHFESDHVYQEHKMILNMIEKLQKIEEIVDEMWDENSYYNNTVRFAEKIEQIVRGE